MNNNNLCKEQNNHMHDHENCCCCGHDHEHKHHEYHGADTNNHNHDFSGISQDKQRIYIIDGLDCANCAAKMERKIQSIPEVQAASVTFATKQLKIAAEHPDKLFSKLEKTCRTVESNVSLTAKDNSRSSVSRTNKNFFKDNCTDIISIAVGALFFAAGMIAEHWGMLPLSFILPVFIIAYIILGGEVLWTSIKNISKGQIFDENFLMSIATISAFFIGEFPEGVGVMLFYRIGEFFEHIAVEKSRSQIMNAVDMRTETVNIIKNGKINTIPTEKANPGDILAIGPGERIPLDGIVIEGESRIDTSPVTGEPVPVSAVSGTELISGCINVQGLLKMKVLKPLSESMVTRILDSVENAAAGKPKIDKFITRFAKIYTPIVVLLALLTALIPSIVSGNWAFWIRTAITFLVISCPCALVISVPLAFFSGIGAASKLGILFKGGISIEALKKVKAVVMDKTGTLTKGNFALQKIVPSNDTAENELLSLAASCETSSSHPIAISIKEAADAKKIKITSPEKMEEFSGMGIKAEISGDTVLCGNKALMDNFNVEFVPPETSSTTEVFIAVNGRYFGYITISDTVKEDASKAVSALKDRGILPVMLTGDNEASAAAVAEKVGISKLYSRLMPDDKLNILREIREKTGPVMFVGDGINDAPVLAGADVGAAMGSGADAAIEAADVVFMNSSVDSIPKAISIAETTGKTAMQNVIFALAVKLLVLLLGFVGFANIWAAVFADTGVAMLCILNSLRILWK